MGKLYLGDQEISPLIVHEVAKPDARFGLTTDYFGEVGEDGTLNPTSKSFVLDLSGVKTVSFAAWQSKFANVGCIKGLIAPDLVTVGNMGLYDFVYNTALEGIISLPKLAMVGDSGMFNALGGTRVTALFMPYLAEVGNYGLYGVCWDCTELEEVNLDMLMKAGERSFAAAFAYTKIKKISFPALYIVDATAFAEDEWTSYIFDSCDELMEIHFAKAAQPQIEAMVGYADKWGATNATIYFD